MAKGASLRDAAKKAGVSVSTVSLVLNERPNVSYKTAERVRSALKDVGYAGNSRLGGGRLANGRVRRTNRIALVLIGQPRALLATTIYADVVASVENAIRRQGLTMVLLCVPDPDCFAAEIVKYSVDGLLLLGDAAAPGVVEAVWRYPAVRIMGENKQDMPFDRVFVDPYSVSNAAATYLSEQGCKACAFVGRGEGVFTRRMELFCEIAKSRGMVATAFTDPEIVRIDSSIHLIQHDKLAALIDRMLEADPRPTGLMVESDALITCVYHLLVYRGIRPGRDIHIVSVNNERGVLANLSPAPAAIDIQASLIGDRAVDQLVWRIGHRDEVQTSVGIEACVVRPGTAPHLNTFEQSAQSAQSALSDPDAANTAITA